MGKFDISETIGLDLVENRKYSIVINGFRINKVRRFTIRRSIENFVDTFEIQLGNIRNEVSPYVLLADKVQFIRNDKDIIFEGIIEKKITSSDNVDMTITITGRDTIIDTINTSAPFITFKNTTDNAIITKMVEATGRKYDLNLEEARKVSEYTVGPGDSIAAVLDGVAKLNEFFIWKRGNTIIKSSIAKDGQPVYAYHIGQGDYDDSNSERHDSGSNILKYNSEESIEDARTEIQGFSQSGGKSKANLKTTVSVGIYKTNAFQKMIRDGNGHNGSSSRIIRKATMSVSGKNLADCQREVEVAAKKSEPKVRISLTVKGFQDFELNDIISLTHYGEGINKNFVLTGIMYTLDEYNREVSELTLQPLGCYPR